MCRTDLLLWCVCGCGGGAWALVSAPSAGLPVLSADDEKSSGGVSELSAEINCKPPGWGRGDVTPSSGLAESRRRSVGRGKRPDISRADREADGGAENRDWQASHPVACSAAELLPLSGAAESSSLEVSSSSLALTWDPARSHLRGGAAPARS